MDEAIKWHIENMTIPHMIEKQKFLHPLSVLARNDLLKRRMYKGGFYA